MTIPQTGTPQPEPVVAPLPASNQVDAVGQRSAQEIARRVVQMHAAGLRARRDHDLLSELLLLHIDGSGDSQWASIFQGQRVEIPRLVSEFRKTENLLRLIVDNAVAHHTTMPLRYLAESTPDRRSRERAIVDMLWMNHLADQQDLNGLFADALYMAMPAGFCFDSETEVLTDSGFKFFRDVDIEVDRIASLDPATGKLTYAKAVAKQELPYDGIMYHWSSRYIDLMVTPEHRMLVYQRQREVAKNGGSVGDWIPPYRNGDLEKRTGELRFVPAAEAAQQGEIWVRKDAIWEGEEPKTFTLPAPVRSKYGPRAHRDSSKIGVEDYLRFMGWYLSEGSFYSRGCHYQVALTQKDDAVRGELGDLLARATNGRPRHKNIQVVVDSKPLCEYVRQFGHSWEKFVPSNIKAMSPRLIRIFLDALFRGDGSVRDGRWTAYYTSSRRLWDDVQELLLKVGLSYSARKRDGGTDCGEVNGVRIKQRRDCYEVSVNHESLRPMIDGEPSVAQYKGTVWDLTVPPNGTLFVRRNGKVVWSGNCPMHRYWRNSPTDSYEPIPADGSGQTVGPRPGQIDCWVGNPFDTVFGLGAKRGSAYWASYGRVLPADMVRGAFDHIPGARGLEGSTRIPSASVFQRIASSWRMGGLGVHGSSVIQRRRDQKDGEELILLLCHEVLPGVDVDHPDGWLRIVAVPGEADLRRGEGQGSRALLLADQALPAGDFSWTNVYSHHRGDDIHGKPWVEDIDQLQVDLNICLSKIWEFLNRAMEAPIFGPGGALSDDMLDIGGYNYAELDPSLASWRPRVMEWPAYVLQGLEKRAEELRRAIYTGGGYQASSRGEAPGSRMAAKAIMMLQMADNSIHGPVNKRFQRAACDFGVGCWKQMKTYGSIPWLIGIAGDEYAHLIDGYVDSSNLSDSPPTFKLVNAFGPSPELRAQEILELCQLRGADDEPFLRTEEAQRLYPNPMMFGDATHPKVVQKRRAKVVAAQITHLAAQFREQTGFDVQDIASPWTQQAAMQVFAQVEQRFPRLRDDDLMAHLAALSEIVQDESADPIARLAAIQRQALMYEWQAMQAGQVVPQQGAPGPAGAPQRGELDPRAIAAQMRGAGPGAVLEQESAGPSPIVATARG